MDYTNPTPQPKTSEWALLGILAVSLIVGMAWAGIL